MAITIEANYQKRLGLPHYSSHAYSVTVKTEVSDLSLIDEASAHLYRQLQQAVDRDIQATGFLPDGKESAPPESFTREQPARLTRERQRPPMRMEPDWSCSPKQQSLIERLMREHGIKRDKVDELARSRFRVALEELNKLQASGLIDELIGTYGRTKGKARS